MNRRRERGYALVAVIAALAGFAILALEGASLTRSAVDTAQADVSRARLDAACQAGLALAVHRLAARAVEARWAIDGRPYAARFGPVRLRIVIEDERGKVPINIIDEVQARRLFELAGAQGQRLETLVDSFADWRDEDEEPRPHGRESAGSALPPRDGAFVSIDELRQINGMDAALFARLRPAITVVFGESGGFSPKTAQPLALAVMTGRSLAAAQALRGRPGPGGSGGKPDEPLQGRALTVRVEASDGEGNRQSRVAIVEFMDAGLTRHGLRMVE